MHTQHQYDALIIGSGAAGLSLALRLADDHRISLISKGPLKEGSTLYAQGGVAAVLASEAERLGTTTDALALAAVLARPWVDVVLSGAATEEHLVANLAAARVPWDGEAEDTLAELAEPSDGYWTTRKALPWN